MIVRRTRPKTRAKPSFCHVRINNDLSIVQGRIRTIRALDGCYVRLIFVLR